MLSLKIALRYLVSKKSHAAVNVISAISVAGVAVATAAIVVVLSVFNGFSDLAKSHFSDIDPDLLISPASGKVIAEADSLAKALRVVDGVAATAPTLTERGLLVAGEAQLGVVFKGVSPDYGKVIDLDRVAEMTSAVYPEYLGENEVISDMAIGVASRLNLRPGVDHVELYVPRRVGRINPANPAGAFFSQGMVLRNVLAVNQMEFDADHIIIPLDAARALLAYDSEASNIEIKLKEGVSDAAVAKVLRQRLGDEFVVATQIEQHAESYKMIAVEKWVTFAMLIFILVIAAFNIISTLSLMVIEKRDNMATLRFLGASKATVRAVFMWMGAIITLAGGLIGMTLGIALSLAQQYGGFIRLSGDPDALTVDTYPVHVEPLDILTVLVLIIAMSLITSLITRLFTRKLA